MEKLKGRIKRFHQVKGYGFITDEKGRDLFFHISDFPELRLDANEEVEFDIEECKTGEHELKATKIRRLKKNE